MLIERFCLVSDHYSNIDILWFKLLVFRYMGC